MIALVSSWMVVLGAIIAALIVAQGYAEASYRQPVPPAAVVLTSVRPRAVHDGSVFRIAVDSARDEDVVKALIATTDRATVRP